MNTKSLANLIISSTSSMTLVTKTISPKKSILFTEAFYVTLLKETMIFGSEKRIVDENHGFILKVKCP